MQRVGVASTSIPAMSRTTAPAAPLSWGMVFLMLFLLVGIGRIQDIIPFLAPLRIGLVPGGLAGLIWLMAPGSIQDKTSLKIKQVKYVLILLGLAVVTIPVSIWPGGSFTFLTEKYWKLVLSFLLVLFWSRTVGDIRRLMWLCCGAAVFLVLSGLLAGQMGDERFQHANSRSYDPNDLALLLVMMLPLILYLFSASGGLLRILLLGMTGLCLYGIVLSRSRGGFLALLVVGSVILWRGALSRSAKVIVGTIVVIVYGMFAGSVYWNRIGTMWNPETEYDHTAGGRTEVWKTGVRILATHPWGVGINGFGIAEGLSHGGHGKWSAAHNSFLQIGVELGIAGLVVFVLLLTRTIKQLREIQRSTKVSHAQWTAPTVSLQPRERTVVGTYGTGDSAHFLAQLAAALETSLWGFIVGGFFLSHAYSAPLYVVLAFSLACIRLARLHGLAK